MFCQWKHFPVLRAPPLSCKGGGVSIGPCKGGKVLLAPCPPPAKEGNKGLGELFVLFRFPAKGDKFLLAQRPPPANLEQRGRGLVRKTFFCFINGNIFCYLHPKGNIFLFSTHISTLFNL